MNIMMIMDESGSMPRADKDETEYGDFGLNVGLLIHPTQESSFREYLEQNCPIPLGKNTHITDLANEDQESVRLFAFDALKRFDIQIVYEAIYVNGFHYAEKVLLEKYTTEEALPEPRVKVSKKHDNPSMQSKLIEGTILKAISFVFEKVGEHHVIKILTDRVEDKLLQEVRSEIDHIYDLQNPQKNEFSGFDTKTKKIVKKTMTTTVEGLPDLPKNEYDIQILPKDHVLNLAADVVANSLYHHIRSMVEDPSSELPTLNARGSIAGYELEHLIIVSSEDYSDKYYKHSSIRAAPRQFEE